MNHCSGQRRSCEPSRAGANLDRVSSSRPACNCWIRFSAVFFFAAIAIGAAVFGCDQTLFRDDLEAIQARGALRVITRNNGTCYYEGPHRPEGFEYDLVKAFADHLGLTLELIIIDSEPEMVTELLQGHADLIAANFLVKEDLRRYLSYGPVYGA